MSKSTHTNMAGCSRCGIRHTRPVGNRCKRLLNVSAPVGSETHQEDQADTSQQADQQATGSQQSLGESAASAATGSKTSQVESKLDLILKKMGELEDKNNQLERRLDKHPQTSGTTSRLSHSSPKRSHICSGQCEPKLTTKPRRAAKQVKLQESSDEEYSSVQTPQASSTQVSQLSDSEFSVTQPSLQFLREDDRTQRKVQKQLQKLQGQTRGASSQGNKTFKSGLHRSGDNAIKVEIPWPHHHCFPGQGGKPEYKDLSPIQFMIGFMGCIQEESSRSVKSNMLEYGRHLLQDALETNWATARHAHLMLLQEIERGKCSWKRPDAIEKIRIRNTARVISTKASGTAPKTAKHSSRDKVCTDFNSNNCKFPGDHIVDGQIVKHACSYCFKETGRICHHKVQDCIRRKNSDSNKDTAKQS